MEKLDRHENFPGKDVFLTNVHSLGLYASGLLIIYKLGLIYAFAYLLYIFILEFRLLRNHCINCYYWGKTCGFGKGRLSAFFFKQGEPSKFCSKEMKWEDMIPDMLVSLVPLIAGIILLIIDFEWIVLFLVALLIFLTTFGNSYVRGKIACKYCKQRDIGCPAEKLFRKE